MSSDTPFTRNNLDFYLKELAKVFRRLNGSRMSAEIILVGGASVLANYSFREMTYDMDAIISASSAIKDAINQVGDQYGLPNGWLNTDFIRTISYSPKLVEFSTYYKTFSKILVVRTIADEYLIAMKLKSGRRYKNDLSDIAGIISEHSARGNSLTFDQIDKAVCNLYGSWEGISVELREFIVSVLEQPDHSALYEQYRLYENQMKDILLEPDRDNLIVGNKENTAVIIEKAKRMKQSKNE
ncbi:MAG: DUF6036 family nucleotidyltransferase [Bacillota bacterium]|nr:DUF6036 family nucleotidyltransferase [Bacillota bacterium]